MAKAATIATGPLRNLLVIGRVGHDQAVVLLRVERPAKYELTVWCSADCPPQSKSVFVAIDDLRSDLTRPVTLRGLQPGRDYRIELRDSFGVQLAHGRFHTTPLKGEASTHDAFFSIAVFSCYQPFNDAGEVDAKSARMLECAHELMHEKQCRIALMVGDQMYADAPRSSSLFADEKLFGLDTQAVREAYQARYRRFWNVYPWKILQAERPCYPVPDDHDVVDNFGSSPDHASDEWEAIRNGAFEAFGDYQAARMAHDASSDRARLRTGFSFDFHYGPVGGFALDLRSQRRVGSRPQLIEDAQFDSLKAVLRKHADKPVFILAMSLPLLHVPRTLAWLGGVLTSRGSDFEDRLSHPNFDKDRNRLIGIIAEHRLEYPDQRFVIASGDIHIGAVTKVAFAGLGVEVHQLISSPLANRESILVSLASRLSLLHHTSAFGRGAHRVTSSVLKAVKPMRNPYCGLNVGFIEVSGPWEAPILRLSLYGFEKGKLNCVYRTEAL